MNRMSETLRRIWFLLNRSRLERELQEEMAAHREMLEAAGRPRRFGATLHLREEVRDVWGWNWLDQLGQDLCYAGRVLRRSPVYTLTAALLLSLGLGVNLAFFQILNVMVLQPPEVKEPHTLVRFYRRSPRMSSSGLPYAATQFYRQHNTVLSAVITETSSDVAWGDDAADRLRAHFVSANYFDELGWRAARGRVFSETADEAPDAPPVVVLSHSLWQERFHADPAIAGRTVRLNDRPATVIGVAPEEFPGLRKSATPHLWLLIHQFEHFHPGAQFQTDWENGYVNMYGRLRPGISAAAARDGMQAAVRELAAQRPGQVQADEWLEPDPRNLGSREFRQIWAIVALLGGLTLAVFIVACSNLGLLALSRATGRLREFAVRAALGAGRGRVVRQLMTESTCLLFGGAAGGLLLGVAVARLILVASGGPAHLSLAPDWRTALAMIGLAAVTMLLCGLLPAWKLARQDLGAAMKDGAQQSSAGLGRTRLQKVLVAAQVAGSCVVLFVAGLMVRGLQRLLADHPGFEYENVVVLDASLERYGIQDAAARSFWEQVRRDLLAHPETESAALTTHAPLGRSLNQGGYRDAPGLRVTSMSVENGFFALLRIPLLAGRPFEPGDDPRSTVIISRRLAEAMYGTTSALGQAFPKNGPGEKRTIVGITGDARLIKVQATNGAEAYYPIDPRSRDGLLLIARARGNPERLLDPMRAAAKRADSRVLAAARLMRMDFERRIETPRLSAQIASLVGLLVLALASLGIFGLVTYSVAARTREIGIRVALGAARPAVMALCVRQLAWPVGLGALFGVAAGIPAAQILARDPFYLQPADPVATLAPMVVFTLAGSAAALLPALRALRIDPVQALRCE